MDRKFNNEFAREIIEGMPAEKMERLVAEMRRNAILTSHYGFSFGKMTVYKEGWYIEFDGCRTHFAVWAGDNDGEFKYGRKPAEKMLNRLYGTDISCEDVLKNVG